MAVMSANAREYVARPGPGSGVQPYGLFSVANMETLPEHASVFGIEFQTPYCALPTGFVVNCPPGSKSSITTGAYTTVTGDPFVVIAGMECGALTAGSPGQSPDEYTRDFVVEKLRAGEQRAVESIFSRGLFGQAPGLSTFAGTTTVPTPTLDNFVNGVQALEAAYGAVYGLPGVLHVPLKAIGQLENGHVIEKDGSRWVTASGTRVSIGNYQGYGPTDVAPADAAHRWLYMTGPVTVFSQPEPFVSPWETSIDKTTNQIHRFAERTYIVTFECVSFAVLSNIEACC
jgi:hypothetical protein